MPPPTEEEMEQAKELMAAMMAPPAPPEDDLPSTFMLYGDVNEERAGDVVSALLLIGESESIKQKQNCLKEKNLMTLSFTSQLMVDLLTT